ALQRTNEAVAVAHRLNRPFSMAYALFHASLLHLWRRELELVKERAEAVLEITEKHDFPIWEAVAGCLRGAALVGMGRADEGLMESSQGMNRYRGLRTPPVFWPLLLVIRAGVCGQAGRFEEGLASVDEALGFVGPDSGSPLAAEFCRVKGELLLASSSENIGQAETWFRQALGIARERQAGMFELRAAVSLSRLWRRQGKAEEGRQVLRDSYSKLTEGFATTDLREAGEELS
ncbi:MAG TPA: hypothetical protein VIT18_07590, partial [Terrimicrobiaceae bacterium]